MSHHQAGQRFEELDDDVALSHLAQAFHALDHEGANQRLDFLHLSRGEPRIGETIARRIVRFRTSSASDPLRASYSVDGPDPTVDKQTFASSADLERVRGIGPKTVERIAPWLSFEEIPSRDR